MDGSIVVGDWSLDSWVCKKHEILINGTGRDLWSLSGFTDEVRDFDWPLGHKPHASAIQIFGNTVHCISSGKAGIFFTYFTKLEISHVIQLIE